MTPQRDEQGRARLTRHVHAPASALWASLADGWLYASWVVGASRVRSVDLAWPAVASRIQHSFGLWPVVIDDESMVLEAVPEHLLILQAKGWPLGEARVELRITEAGPGACEVSIVEDAVKGPGTVVPRRVRQSAIAVRNHEALRRLALIAEGRHHEDGRRALEGPPHSSRRSRHG